MSNKTYLFKKSINGLLNLITKLPVDQNVMASDVKLIKLLNVSRTTVRSCVEYLIEQGIIKRDGIDKVVLRQPVSEDFFDIKAENSTKDIQIEKYFLNLINTGKLLPGDRFSELSLAKSSSCTTITVREFLIKFSNSRLIEKVPRGRWKMVKFDEELARESVLFREMIEMQALTELLKFPKEHPVWQELHELLVKYQEVSQDIETRYLEFPNLDKSLHLIILKSSNNRFTQQFFDIVSFVCHYHYQWDKTGELERFTVAVEEHIDILNNLITHNTVGAILSMEKHLVTTEKTLLRCVHRLDS